jgi:ferredoxin-thioredoxin reductase catalytic subunit
LSTVNILDWGKKICDLRHSNNHQSEDYKRRCPSDPFHNLTQEDIPELTNI